jgi:hypothetical protein
MRFNICLGVSYHELLNMFNDSGVVSDSLTDVHNALVKDLHVVDGT